MRFPLEFNSTTIGQDTSVERISRGRGRKLLDSFGGVGFLFCLIEGHIALCFFLLHGGNSEFSFIVVAQGLQHRALCRVYGWVQVAVIVKVAVSTGSWFYIG